MSKLKAEGLGASQATTQCPRWSSGLDEQARTGGDPRVCLLCLCLALLQALWRRRSVLSDNQSGIVIRVLQMKNLRTREDSTHKLQAVSGW